MLVISIIVLYKYLSSLNDTGDFAKKDRITHRIEISSLKDIDDEVRKWMKIAYDMDGSKRRNDSCL
jgi:hypothetical protein